MRTSLHIFTNQAVFMTIDTSEASNGCLECGAAPIAFEDDDSRVGGELPAA